jgi:hypothetical protein
MDQFGRNFGRGKFDATHDDYNFIVSIGPFFLKKKIKIGI